MITTSRILALTCVFVNRWQKVAGEEGLASAVMDVSGPFWMSVDT